MHGSHAQSDAVDEGYPPVQEVQEVQEVPNTLYFGAFCESGSDCGKMQEGAGRGSLDFAHNVNWGFLDNRGSRGLPAAFWACGTLRRV